MQERSILFSINQIKPVSSPVLSDWWEVNSQSSLVFSGLFQKYYRKGFMQRELSGKTSLASSPFQLPGLLSEPPRSPVAGCFVALSGQESCWYWASLGLGACFSGCSSCPLLRSSHPAEAPLGRKAQVSISWETYGLLVPFQSLR